MARTLSKKHIFKTTVGVGGVPSNSQNTIPMTAVPADIASADYLPNEITITDGTNYEAISFTGYTAPNLTGCTRGIDGTTALPWDALATIYFAPVPKNVDDVESALDALGTRIDGVSATSYGDLYVTDAGGIKVNIASGKFYDISTGALVSYAGTTDETLTDDSDNYIELTDAGALNIETSGFTAGSIPLAKVTCLSTDITTVLDKRPIVVGGKYTYTPPTTASTELTYSATTDIDFDDAINFDITLTGNVTFTFSNPTEGMVKKVRIIQDSTGSRTVTFPASMTYVGGEAITFTTTGDAVDEIIITYDGTSYTVFELGLDIKTV